MPRFARLVPLDNIHHLPLSLVHIVHDSDVDNSDTRSGERGPPRIVHE
ncbi:hypothetical protein NY08_566 [Rhodococcus sp. B7740]|nr:hypothetical protein NY08_566 [Rhodococcus sp. B7740]